MSKNPPDMLEQPECEVMAIKSLIDPVCFGPNKDGAVVRYVPVQRPYCMEHASYFKKPTTGTAILEAIRGSEAVGVDPYVPRVRSWVFGPAFVAAYALAVATAYIGNLEISLISSLFWHENQHGSDAALRPVAYGFYPMPYEKPSHRVPLDAEAFANLPQAMPVAAQLGDAFDHGLIQGVLARGNSGVLQDAHDGGAMEPEAGGEPIDRRSVVVARHDLFPGSFGSPSARAPCPCACDGGCRWALGSELLPAVFVVRFSSKQATLQYPDLRAQLRKN